MSANGSVNIIVGYNNSLNTGTGGTLTDVFNDNLSLNFGPGTAANQMDQPWSHTNTLTNAADTFTLSALVGPGAATTNQARTRAFYIRNLATVDGNVLVVTPGATHPLSTIFGTGGITIPAGGAALFLAPLTIGYAVVASTTDEITVTATGTVPYKIASFGVSV